CVCNLDATCCNPAFPIMLMKGLQMKAQGILPEAVQRLFFFISVKKSSNVTQRQSPAGRMAVFGGRVQWYSDKCPTFVHDDGFSLRLCLPGACKTFPSEDELYKAETAHEL
ncbi:hypothetical protein KUCAC02_036270, partial [Chaenocephalus aceratus]